MALEQMHDYEPNEESFEAWREAVRADFIAHCKALLAEAPAQTERGLPRVSVYDHVALRGNGYVEEVKRFEHVGDAQRLLVERERHGMRLLGRQVGSQVTIYRATLHASDAHSGDVTHHVAELSPDPEHDFDPHVASLLINSMHEVQNQHES